MSQQENVKRELAALDGRIEGDLIDPQSPEYESVRKPAWAQYEHLRPEAVVRSKTPTDIAESPAVDRPRRTTVLIATA